MIHLVWMEVTNCHGGSNASGQAGGRSEIPIKQQKNYSMTWLMVICVFHNFLVGLDPQMRERGLYK